MSYSSPKSKRSMLKSLDKTLKIQEKTFKSGEGGNLQTASFMASKVRERAGHKLVRQLAIKIINEANTKSHFHLDESRAVGRWVQSQMRYLKDPIAIELLQDPVLMIEKLAEGTCRGDCDDMSLLTATLLHSIGIRPYFKLVKYRKNSKSYNHIYVMVHESNNNGPKKWLALDAIIKDKDIGFEVKHQDHALVDALSGKETFLRSMDFKHLIAISVILFYTFINSTKNKVKNEA